MLDRQELVELVNAGLSDREIADKVGVVARTVLRWRARHGLASRWTPPVPPHGTIGRYKHHACRCTPCRAANAADHALRVNTLNRRTAATASRSYEPWTPAEDAVVLAHRPVESATLLGRSWSACRARRDHLRRQAQEEGAAAA